MGSDFSVASSEFISVSGYTWCFFLRKTKLYAFRSLDICVFTVENSELRVLKQFIWDAEGIRCSLYIETVH